MDPDETFAEVVNHGTCTVTGRLELKLFNQDIENAIFVMQMAVGIRIGSEEGRIRSKACKK